jgi:hypothetical protein
MSLPSEPAAVVVAMRLRRNNKQKWCDYINDTERTIEFTTTFYFFLLKMAAMLAQMVRVQRTASALTEYYSI